jgi:4-hydroxybenzoate polyprenyltransferase
MKYTSFTYYYRRALLYLRVARLDHWFKNIFLLAGTLMALLDPEIKIGPPWLFAGRTVLAFFLACFAASSNYIVNEILDGPRDRLHPVKRFRPVPRGIVSCGKLWVMAVLFALTSLVIAYLFMSRQFFLTLAAFILMGLIYNIPPVRTKEIVYLDAATEAIDNPIRLFLGWYAVTTLYPPPLTLVLSYWAFGAFLMTAKRYAEYRFFANPEAAAAYRGSFRRYTEENLLLAMICYISLTMFFFGALVMRYRRYELFLVVPFVIVFVGWFFKLAFKNDSFVREPERLWREEPAFAGYSIFMFVIFVILAFIKTPFLWKAVENMRIGPPLP